MVSHQTADDVSLIWERAEPVARGGTSAVSRDHITQAAFEIADREGLHAVSVKRVASRLRIPAVRLDAYLSSREDLLDLMLDGAFAEIDPIHEGDDWRSRLRAMAHATQQTARRHPWLRALAGTRTPCGPNGLRHSERALAALEGLGLDAATMTQAVNTVLAYVYGYVQLEMLEPSRKLDESVDLERRTHTARYLIEQMGTGEYPTLARVFADASNLTAADAFETGLDYVLDGIANQVSASAGGAAHDGGGIVENEAPTSTPEAETAEPSPGDHAGQPIEQASPDDEPTGARRLGRRRAGR